MRKFFVLVLGISSFLFAQTATAQSKNPIRLGIGIDAGSTLKDPTRLILGADARLQIPLGNSFSAIVTTGYYNVFKIKNAYGGYNVGIVPIKGGIKYFPARNVYIAGEAGVGLLTKGDNNVSFVYSPSVGVAFRNGLDVSLKYEDYTKYNGYLSQLALRLAYGFKL